MPAAADDDGDVDKHNVDCDSDGGDDGDRVDDVDNGNVDKRNLPKKFKPLPLHF